MLHKILIYFCFYCVFDGKEDVLFSTLVRGVMSVSALILATLPAVLCRTVFVCWRVFEIKSPGYVCQDCDV